VGWAEWNDRYRDTVRSYWKGDGGLVADLAYRITGSSDLYGHSGRRPYASVNFVTAHDGFTLQDLVSYNEKHNEANGEIIAMAITITAAGIAEPKVLPTIPIFRLCGPSKSGICWQRCCSPRRPHDVCGRCIGHTQNGNNNAYCQDNEISWLKWDLKPSDRDLLAFVQRMINLRKRHPVFRRAIFFKAGQLKARL